MKYLLPNLAYSYDALEPFFDAATMEIHHKKHHQTYTDKLNAVLDKYPELADLTVEEMIKNISTVPMDEADKKAVINHGGGYINHNLFWQILSPVKEVNQELVSQIESKFGSVEVFKEEFSKVALNHFGSGWAWLVNDEQGELQIYSLPNQDSPLAKGHTPIFCLDLWEHSYYLKFQNRRADYVQAWWNVLKFIN
jgi:superoxide dismutase, Fe-Mn family